MSHQLHRSLAFVTMKILVWICAQAWWRLLILFKLELDFNQPIQSTTTNSDHPSLPNQGLFDRLFAIRFETPVTLIEKDSPNWASSIVSVGSELKHCDYWTSWWDLTLTELDSPTSTADRKWLAWQARCFNCHNLPTNHDWHDLQEAYPVVDC